MAAEFDALLGKNTWSLVPYTSDIKVITNKWVFRVKLKADGTLDKLKARLVDGFEQITGVDFLETFSHVVKPSIIRLVFSFAASKRWSIQQIDVNSAFLNGDLEDTIYMTRPVGFESLKFPTHVCKLNKALYGLKQAPRAWYDKLRDCLYTLGFNRSMSDFSLFHRTINGILTLVLIYVDDILVTCDSHEEVMLLISQLNDLFALKYLGKVNYFLGVEVTKTKSTFSLCQYKYLLELLQKTQMLDCKTCATPMGQAIKCLMMPLYTEAQWVPFNT